MGKNAVLSKDLACPFLLPPSLSLFLLAVHTRVREEKEGRRRWWGESRGREHRRCLKTGSGHKGNRTLAYAWLFYSMPRSIPKPLSLSPLPSYGSPREGTSPLHRCTRMPAKYYVIIRRAPTGFVYLHQSRISNRAQCSIARCSPRGERSSRSLNIEFYCFKKGSILSVKISQFYSIRAIVKRSVFAGGAA